MTNRFKTDEWKTDSWASVDFYNQWFMQCAPKAFKTAREGVMKQVISSFKKTDFLRCVESKTIIENPSIIQVLRACTAPQLAIDRLSGLAYTRNTIIKRLEEDKLPSKISQDILIKELDKILGVITNLLDYEIFPWLSSTTKPTPQSLNRSAAIVSDRISGSLSDPIIRNAQEERQLKAIDNYLISRGYSYAVSKDFAKPTDLPPFTFSHHFNVPVLLADKSVNMPIDVVIQTGETSFPLLIECKSAGDFTNTNKRRKEEAVKALQLKQTYGNCANLILFLCGYFDVSYLGYEASEGIDWVWEHRISDFEQFGI